MKNMAIFSCLALLAAANFCMAFGEEQRMVSIVGCTNGPCFVPCNIAIIRGDTVTWVNRDSAVHMIVSGSGQGGPDGWFASGYVPQHGTFSYKFDRVGPFVYFDVLHPYAQGVVIVGQSQDSSYVKLQQSFFSDWCRR